MEKTIEYVDAQEMARLHPDTFGVPSQELLDAITEGASVKVCANDERFWVTVASVDGENITGTVDNNLVNQPEDGLASNDTISFSKANIYDIW